MGMDWHSSDVTTSVMGALKKGLNPKAHELGLYICGGHPFPVPLEAYDESIAVLRRALDAAKLGHSEKLDGMSRLDRFTQSIERHLEPDADVEAIIAHERAVSPVLRRTHGVRRPSTAARGQAP